MNENLPGPSGLQKHNDSIENSSADEIEQRQKVNKNPKPQVMAIEVCNQGLGVKSKRARVEKKQKSVQRNPCKSCQNKCATKLSESQRQEVFDFYWKLPHTQQIDWILSCVDRVPIKRRRSKEIEKKTETRKYFINFEGKRIQVCMQFLLKTLNISSRVVTYALEKTTVLNTSETDKRGAAATFNATSADLKEAVCTFIESLPRVPSHYCRSRTNRTYLPTECFSISNLYRKFKEIQVEQGINFVSEKIFRGIFKTYNIGIHVPKKDKCTFCESYKDRELDETQKVKVTKHSQQKETSHKLFMEDQEKAKSSPSFVCASFDLQKVLNVPHTQSMLFYYSRKYSFYNETIYESGTHNAYAFVWGEVDGMRGANEICTILNQYLKIVDERKTVTSISLYCDSCPGQNKNRQIITMIFLFIQKQAKHINEIKLTFLLPGHTYMPVDSVHATIERFVKKRTIWTPSEWVTLISNARINPKPYEVVVLTYKDFRDWKKEALKYFPTQGVKTKEQTNFKITESNILIFSKSSPEIKYLQFQTPSPSYTLDFCRTRNQVKCLEKFNEPDILYSSKLAISGPKRKDLESLLKRKFIPERYIEEYEDIIKNTFGEKEDELAETDEEDDLSDNQNDN